MKNPLENFKNPWDADGEIAQQFLNISNVLGLPTSQEDEDFDNQPEPYPWRIWGVFFEDEQKAYKFMIEKSKELGVNIIEFASYVTERGVFVLPSIENTKEDVNGSMRYISYAFIDNRQERIPYKNNFRVHTYQHIGLELKDPRYKKTFQRWKNVGLLNTSNALKVYAYVHTHPFISQLSEGDRRLSAIMEIPIYAMGIRDGVVGYYFRGEEGSLAPISDVIEFKSILDHAKKLNP